MRIADNFSKDYCIEGGTVSSTPFKSTKIEEWLSPQALWKGFHRYCPEDLACVSTNIQMLVDPYAIPQGNEDIKV